MLGGRAYRLHVSVVSISDQISSLTHTSSPCCLPMTHPVDYVYKASWFTGTFWVFLNFPKRNGKMLEKNGKWYFWHNKKQDWYFRGAQKLGRIRKVVFILGLFDFSLMWL